MTFAAHGCAHCNGTGLMGRSRARICACVWRAVFRECYRRWQYIQFAGQVGRRGYIWGRPNEEFCADFELVAQRALAPEDYQVFRMHFLLGADYRACCRKLDMDRGSFFHAVYRIERVLGQTYSELVPYALHPIDEYFHGVRRMQQAVVSFA